MIRVFAALVLAAVASGAALADAPLWTVEEGSSVGFVATQGGAPVEGIFERFEAEIRFDPDVPESGRVNVTIHIDSVNSESADRDGTIRSESLFDVATWPTAQFVTETLSAREGGYDARGSLTMRDVTRDVVLPFTLEVSDHPDDAGALRARAAGELEVLRLDYGVGQGMWQDISVVGNEVIIKIDIVARRPKG